MSDKKLRRIIVALVLIMAAAVLLERCANKNCTRQTITIDGKTHTTCAEWIEDHAQN